MGGIMSDANGANAPELTANAESNSNAESMEPTTPQANERLLRESKEHKLRAQKAEAELERIKAERLKEQGKYENLWKSEKAAHDKLQQTLMLDRIRTAVKEEALKVGCSAPDVVYKLADSGLIQYDPDSLEVIGADVAVQKVRAELPALFTKAAKTVVNPTTPSGVVEQQKPSAADIAKDPMKRREALAAMFAKK